MFEKSVFSQEPKKTQLTEEATDETEHCVNSEKCGERTSMYCSDCKVFICDSCEQSHVANVFSRNHKRENQRQQQQQQEKKKKKIDRGLETLKMRHCSTHPSEYLSGFCFECSLFVCVNCVGDHKEHRQNICLLEESVLRRRNEILKIGVRLRRNWKVLKGQPELSRKRSKN